jgi:hypothetical protein
VDRAKFADCDNSFIIRCDVCDAQSVRFWLSAGIEKSQLDNLLQVLVDDLLASVQRLFTIHSVILSLGGSW